MPEQPAARVSDTMICPLQTPTPAGPVPHAVPPGNPIQPPGCLTVQISNQPAARIGDQSMCVTPGGPVPNPIMRGAFPVLVGGQPAARMTDQGTHPGSTVAPPCCPTVLIGQAGTSGNPWAGAAQCQAAAAGRNPPPGTLDPNGNQIPPNTPGQSYNNCGVESARNIINQATGANIDQETLLNQAMASGNAIQIPGNLWASGATYPGDIATILQTPQPGYPSGVPAGLVAPTLQNLEVATAQGRGVVAFVDAGTLWAPSATPPAGGNHWVQVTGVKYDADGNITHVIINDTGIGTCGQEVPIARWQAATSATGGCNEHIVTDDPIH